MNTPITATPASIARYDMMLIQMALSMVSITAGRSPITQPTWVVPMNAEMAGIAARIRVCVRYMWLMVSSSPRISRHSWSGWVNSPTT
ncbi:hypothetical protein D3C85_1603520 [compost metagenome]